MIEENQIAVPAPEIVNVEKENVLNTARNETASPKPPPRHRFALIAVFVVLAVTLLGFIGYNFGRGPDNSGTGGHHATNRSSLDRALPHPAIDKGFETVHINDHHCAKLLPTACFNPTTGDIYMPQGDADSTVNAFMAINSILPGNLQLHFVIFDPSITAGRETKEVSGHLNAAQLLDRMLEGSGLIRKQDDDLTLIETEITETSATDAQ